MSQVFIGSIFYEVTEQQLRDAFSPFGQIKVVNLNLDPMTGKHKGFAFIWFDIPEAAQLAIEAVSQKHWILKLYASLKDERSFNVGPTNQSGQANTGTAVH